MFPGRRVIMEMTTDSPDGPKSPRKGFAQLFDDYHKGKIDALPGNQLDLGDHGRTSIKTDGRNNSRSDLIIWCRLPHRETLILQLDTDLPGWQATMIKLFKSIQGVSYSIDAQTRFAHVSGTIDKALLLKSLAKSSTHAFTHHINYGITLPEHTSEPLMKCVLQVDTDIPNWHKGMCLLFESMEGVTFSINAFTRQAYISGKIDPLLQLKLLAKAEATGARLCWLYYGCEVDPYGRLVDNEPEPKDETMNNSAPTSKPKNSFCCLISFHGFVCSKAGLQSLMINCILRVDTRFVGWRLMLFRVLDSIDGITYNIDGEKGHVQITGRINPRQLMKILAEVGLHADIYPVSSGYGEMTVPLRHGYDYPYNGHYGYNPYGQTEYHHGYPPQQRNWHPIYENYPHYLHYNQNYPSNEPQAEYFPQPPPQPEGFRNGDPEWCTIM
ncbi:hypothetical protein F3Y22_tig00110458pilonHSYRG00511 [Hibiscus syriacus]|uniref:HMA domain-containing protein n=1 Tax=Hibiscus syriacus TaxID=106335 RepID=A0A6A3AKD2_HIBSY|nr:hypothetical protein F3Y22_tig00110458pilonHSYRG00511 [Hibiscus syriacus]